MKLQKLIFFLLFVVLVHGIDTTKLDVNRLNEEIKVSSHRVHALLQSK